MWSIPTSIKHRRPLGLNEFSPRQCTCFFTPFALGGGEGVCNMLRLRPNHDERLNSWPNELAATTGHMCCWPATMHRLSYLTWTNAHERHSRQLVPPRFNVFGMCITLCREISRGVIKEQNCLLCHGWQYIDSPCSDVITQITSILSMLLALSLQRPDHGGIKTKEVSKALST